MGRSGYQGTYTGAGAEDPPAPTGTNTNGRQVAPEGFVIIHRRLVEKDSPEHIQYKAKQLERYHERKKGITYQKIELVLPEDNQGQPTTYQS
jgi:hypothetical protein